MLLKLNKFLLNFLILAGSVNVATLLILANRVVGIIAIKSVSCYNLSLSQPHYYHKFQDINMPLTTEQIVLQKRIFNEIDVKLPIEHDDDRYVPIYENLENDPIDELKKTIDLFEVESLQFFSGFRGSGKSTELWRLRSKLEAEGCVVLYADALEYINPAVPLNIAELLISIAGAFGDALQANLGKDIITEAYWTRLWHYLNTTEVSLSEFGLGTKGGVGVAEVSGNIKVALKETPSFRQKVQAAMKNRIGELKANVDKFIEDGVKNIQSVKGEDIKIVFIFDSLEQIRGSLNDEALVIKSVEEVFTQNVHLLKLNHLNTIYTVPPWLRFVMTSEDIITLRGIKQWEKNDQRTKYDQGNELLRQVVRKRFKPDGMKLFFGEGDAANNKLDKLVENCGGSLRLLMRMLTIAMRRVKEVPFTDTLIDGVISELENSFIVSVEDARWLNKVAETRTESLTDNASSNISKFTRLIDTQLVLYFRNGKDWYDIHPLIRSKVAKIIEQNPPTEDK